MKITVAMNKTSFSILVLLLFVCSCKKQASRQNVVVGYPVEIIKTTDVVLNTHYAATVTGCQTVEVRPQIDGMLTKICLREGAPVRKGQVLFEIDPAQFQAAYDIAQANVNSAEAAVSTAQLVLNSNKELYEEEVISDFELNMAENELAEAKAKYKLARAELEKASTNLSYTLVKSPVNGIASMIPYRVGALVSSNIIEPLVTVSDDGEVYAYFSLAENQILELIAQYGSMKKAIAEMPEVEFKMINGEMYPLKGRIDAISGTINSTTGAINLRAVFPNPKRILHDGGTGSVVIPSVYTNCMVIPQSATYELQDKIFVYKVVDGKASSTEIKIASNNNGREYVVTEGLSVGDTIVAEGAGLLREGTVITSKTQSK
ncbi:MAG: efflux RND transporter periplasmic adaptor subunit [Bacteroidales bacterium]|nr:efflux RND transporter periplasmic adaptor subunit [Bacteroidales bacterium]